MVKKKTLGLFYRLIISASDWSPMMMPALLNKDPFSFTNKLQLRLPRRDLLFDAAAGTSTSTSLRINASNGLSFRGCSSDCPNGFSSSSSNIIDDEFQKAHALPPYSHLLHHSKSGLDEDTDRVASFTINGGCGDYKHGSPLRILDCVMPEKLIVAVDVDEVLGSFVAALNKFVADRYSSSHSVSEYYVYEFFKIWNCSRDEANFRVHEFFKTSYFKTGIHPIPGAHRTLQKLSTFCNLLIVTSRQNVIKDHTIEWIEKHYPGLFQEVHFGNHFALDGQSRPKSDICRLLGAQVLIDDNPQYAVECAKAGVRVLLFDYENSYPWCKTGSQNLHPLVTKVHNWEEVEQQLVSMDFILDSPS